MPGFFFSNPPPLPSLCTPFLLYVYIGIARFSFCLGLFFHPLVSVLPPERWFFFLFRDALFFWAGGRVFARLFSSGFIAFTGWIFHARWARESEQQLKIEKKWLFMSIVWWLMSLIQTNGNTWLNIFIKVVLKRGQFDYKILKLLQLMTNIGICRIIWLLH